MASGDQPTRDLATYRGKRDFAATAEPSGDGAVASTGDAFVIQKHAARRLHYDLRLELDGVLLSWAVPRGPCLDPARRRLAMRTEDHPLDYAGFEGVIPAGQYGGGAVIVWDRGRWTPRDEPRDALARGRLTFELHGEKLHGRWHLVRTRGDGKRETWMFWKGKDAHADPARDLTVARPESVLTGRTLEQLVGAPRRADPDGQADDEGDLDA